MADAIVKIVDATTVVTVEGAELLAPLVATATTAAGTATNQATIASNAVANLSQISQTLGRSVTPVTSGSGNGANTFVNGTPIAATGTLKQIRVFGKSGGTMKVRRFTLSGGILTQIGSDTNVTVAASSLQTIQTSIAVNAGEYIGFYAAANVLCITNSVTQDPGGYYRPTAAGDVTTVNTADGQVASTTRLELGFDILTQYVTIARVQGIESQQATNTAAANLNSAATANLQEASVTGWDPPAAGSTGNAPGTFVIGTAMSDPGVVTQVRLRGWGGVSQTVKFRRFTLTGGNFVQVGADVPVTVGPAASGLQTIALNIVVNKGEYLGFYAPNFAIAITSGVSNGGNFFSAGTDTTTVSQGSVGSSAVRFELAFDLRLQRVTQGNFAPIKSAFYVPLVSDGRHLYAWKAALAKRLQSGAGKAKILLTGDSWTERYNIPQQLASILYNAYGKAGEGFISVDSDVVPLAAPMNGVTFSKSAGWTLYDASGAAVAPGTLRSGLDGNRISTTATTETVTIGNCTTTQLRVYYTNTTGTFRYRVDGAAWTAVTGDGSNGLGILTVSGLANSAHTFDFDTTGNAGTAVLLGFYATNSTGIGVELSKAGNGSIDAAHVALYAPTDIQPIAADIMPDVVVYILGTNDYQHGISTGTFQSALRAVVTGFRAANPNVGFIFVAPADSNGSGGSLPLTAYRDAMADVAITDGHEFYNMHDEWSTWATENALGMWLDNLHTNDAGAYRVGSRLYNTLLKL